jgi:hypothetical protein
MASAAPEITDGFGAVITICSTVIISCMVIKILSVFYSL